MSTHIKSAILFSTFFLSVLGCSKNPDSSKSNSGHPGTKKYRSINSADSIIISKYWHMGEAHNQGLDDMLDTFKSNFGSTYDIESETTNATLLSSIPDHSASIINSEFEPTNVTINAEVIRTLMPTSDKSFYDEATDADFYSSAFINCMSELEYTVDLEEELSEETYLTLLEENIGNMRDENEKIALTSVISTAYFSLLYWSNSSQGGHWIGYFSDDQYTAIPAWAVKAIAKADVSGAITGGAGGVIYGALGGTVVLPVVGTIAGAAGCGAVGALGGAFGSSAKKAVDKFIDWLLG